MVTINRIEKKHKNTPKEKQLEGGTIAISCAAKIINTNFGVSYSDRRPIMLCQTPGACMT